MMETKFIEEQPTTWFGKPGGITSHSFCYGAPGGKLVGWLVWSLAGEFAGVV